MRGSEIQAAIEVEREDECFEVDVYGKFQKGERSYFNAMEGVGSPGYPNTAEFSRAELNGKEFTLTKEEEEKAQEALDRVLEDGDCFDEPDPPSDREPDSYRDYDNDE